MQELKQDQTLIVNTLESYFDTPHRDILMSLPAKTDVEDYGVPHNMQVGEVDEEGWVRWEMIPSTVTEEQVRKLEQLHDIPNPVPPLYLAYLTTRHVLNVYLRYDHFMIGLPDLPSDNPLRSLHTLWEAWEPLIVQGYIPFATYEDDAGPVCWDIQNPTKDEDYAVVWFDHEALVGQPSWTRAQLAPLVQPLFPSFRTMLTSLHSS
ncbi:hypothetical protein [Paenibacillus tundrae]|uniref:SMI1/KNR4 family protein n=1 Tax=Paenibacillus tundrae TaxID=528187 RepID=A0ABT9WCW6_9BACL|nr:hypothetical protein [Paenibacillus tundrae]MDQ0171099.1 hypothetical protein [Paenibacillus tundrae]